MMPKQLVALLDREVPGEFHDTLLQKCKDLVKLSRDEMSKYYTKWDKYDQAYRKEKERTEKDVKAGQKKEPESVVIPMTFSQINTFVAFCYQVLTQRPTFYELSGSGAEDVQAAKLAEAVLEHNLDHNNWKGIVLPQALLDIARFGLGVVKHSWHEETKKVEKMVQQPVQQVPGMPPVQGPAVMQVVDEVCYQGNKLVNISPYRFFPDPRIPLTRFQEGEFCASEDEYSDFALKRLAKQGLVAGVQHVPKFKTDMLCDGARRVSFADQVDQQVPASENVQKLYIVTEIQLELIPSEIDVEGKPLGTSDMPEKYIVWIANDSRIIRLEPMGYLHNKFTYALAQYSNDQLRFINFGVGEVLDQLQDVQNWFINSHITSVRQVIRNQLIVDPKGINLQDLRDRNPVLRLNPAVQGSGVDRWVKQLQTQDVTQNHVGDSQVLSSFGKEATGITENLLGQFASGRRSATEASNVANSSAARVMLVVHAIWETLCLPQGRQMLSNIRDGMSISQLVKVVGESNLIENQQGAVALLPADKSKLVGDYDFSVFDGTLPSQRGQTAMVLQELLIQLVQKPELCFIFGFDPRPLLNEVLTLRGVRNLQQFRLTPQSAQQLISLAGFARNATASVGAERGSSATGPDNQNRNPK